MSLKPNGNNAGKKPIFTTHRILATKKPTIAWIFSLTRQAMV
jgi:hypothetical protein